MEGLSPKNARKPSPEASKFADYTEDEIWDDRRRDGQNHIRGQNILLPNSWSEMKVKYIIIKRTMKLPIKGSCTRISSIRTCLINR